MKGSLPGRIAAGVVVATLLIALNVTALTFGWKHPEIVAPAILADLGGLALTFWLAWRRALVQQGVTDRVQAALTDTEARYAAILESAMDAVIVMDEQQNVVLFNLAAEKMFGCARGEAIGGPLDRFLPQRFRPTHNGHVKAFGTAGVTTRRMGHNTVLAALRADGTEFPIEASISKSGETGTHIYTGILRDISSRKAAEDALRQSQAELRELSAQVLQAREDEKTRIARELHDELGQQLTALKMDLAWARERLASGHTEVAEKLERMNATLDSTVAATRRISADLRPLMLDDLGLAEAVEWLAEDFSERSGIACELELAEPEAISGLGNLTATAIYRMLQESLTNVARHAQAQHVHVELALKGNEVILRVEDDGRGITEEDRRKTRSFGLKGLRERAHYLGGSAEVVPAPSGGTRVSVRVPARESA
jgi:PAS domain S-box-containing protein